MLTQSPLTILIVDDHPLILSALQIALRSHPSLRIVGEANNGLVGLQLAKDHQPDVVITDINMQPINGIEFTKMLLRQQPLVTVIGYSTADRHQLQMLLDAGASGIIRKGATIRELQTGILQFHQIKTKN
jgi:DNA-binding NarL/FixJ family response regulator